MNHIKLIALDLDGTLLDANSEVAQEEQEALLHAKQMGVQLVISTGRNFMDAEALARSAGGIQWMITQNGAQLWRMSDGKKVHSEPMDRKQCERLMTLCEQYGTEQSFYTDDKVYYGEECFRFLSEFRKTHPASPPVYSRQNYIYVDCETTWRFLVKYETISKAIVYGDGSNIRALTAALRACGEFEAEPSALFNGTLQNVEINRKGVTKGKALHELAQQLGIDRSEVLAIGDSDNDRTMLEYAGIGVAMGNAPEHLRQLADAVAPTNEQHGVAEIIRNYILTNRE